jgi:hypothetical protein
VLQGQRPGELGQLVLRAGAVELHHRVLDVARVGDEQQRRAPVVARQQLEAPQAVALRRRRRHDRRGLGDLRQQLRRAVEQLLELAELSAPH